MSESWWWIRVAEQGSGQGGRIGQGPCGRRVARGRAAVVAEPSGVAARRVCWVRMLRSEVEVLSWSPDRGNPTLKRQGRGPGIDRAAPVRLVVRCGVSVRAGLEEAIGASWWRTKVKRCKAFLGGRAATQRRCPILSRPRAYWRRDHDKVSAFHPRRSAGFRPGSAGRSENERTTARWPSRSPRAE